MKSGVAIVRREPSNKSQRNRRPISSSVGETIVPSTVRGKLLLSPFGDLLGNVLAIFRAGSEGGDVEAVGSLAALANGCQVKKGECLTRGVIEHGCERPMALMDQRLDYAGKAAAAPEFAGCGGSSA